MDFFLQFAGRAAESGVLIRPEAIVAIERHATAGDQEFAVVRTNDGHEYQVKGNWQEIGNKVIGALQGPRG